MVVQRSGYITDLKRTSLALHESQGRNYTRITCHGQRVYGENVRRTRLVRIKDRMGETFKRVAPSRTNHDCKTYTDHYSCTDHWDHLRKKWLCMNHHLFCSLCKTLQPYDKPLHIPCIPADVPPSSGMYNHRNCVVRRGTPRLESSPAFASFGRGLARNILILWFSDARW